MLFLGLEILPHHLPIICPNPPHPSKVTPKSSPQREHALISPPLFLQTPPECADVSIATVTITTTVTHWSNLYYEVVDDALIVFFFLLWGLNFLKSHNFFKSTLVFHHPMLVRRKCFRTHQCIPTPAPDTQYSLKVPVLSIRDRIVI